MTDHTSPTSSKELRQSLDFLVQGVQELNAKDINEYYRLRGEWIEKTAVDIENLITKATEAARIDELENHVAEWLVINNETFEAIKDRLTTLRKEG